MSFSRFGKVPKSVITISKVTVNQSSTLDLNCHIIQVAFPPMCKITHLTSAPILTIINV